MNTILGVAELLAAGELSPEQRRQVDMLRRAGTRLIGVVDHLFEALGVEAGRPAIAEQHEQGSVAQGGLGHAEGIAGTRTRNSSRRR